MPAQSDPMKSGLQALEQGRYSEAIASLEMFCQVCPNPNSKPYMQAQMGLAKAYHSHGNPQKALALMRKLATSKEPQVQRWAQQALQTLSAASPSASTQPQSSAAAAMAPLTAATASAGIVQANSSQANPSQANSSAVSSQSPQALPKQQATELYQRASQALQRQQYPEAITALETYCEGTEANSQSHLQAQMWLVKAYKGNGQAGKATHLCRQLANSPHQKVQIWARQTLPILLSLPASLNEVFAPPSGSTEPPVTEQATPPSETERTAHRLELRSLSELKTYCQKNLRRDLARFERSRQATLQVLAIANAALIVLLIVTLAHFDKYMFMPSPVVTGFLLFGFCLLWVFCQALIARTYIARTYGKGFKMSIIEKIVQFIDINQVLHYSHYSDDAQLDRSMDAFQNSTLFGNYFLDLFEEDDCVWGQSGETRFFFSEICAETESADLAGMASDGFLLRNLFNVLRAQPQRQGLGLVRYLCLVIKEIPHSILRIFWGRKLVLSDFFMETTETRKMLFKGLFFRARFNKNFKGRTVVLPDIAERFLGMVGRTIQSWHQGRGELIQLEDPEFERFFAVYGDDQIEARYILSTSLIARLTDLRKRAGHDVYVAFVRNTIYIAIHYEEDLFEPKLFSSMLSFKPIREYYETFRLMLDIVEDLKLNRRIWKQE